MLIRSTWLPKSTFKSNLHHLKINICDLALDAYPVLTMLLVKFLLNYSASDEAFSSHEFWASDKISYTPLFLRCAFSSVNAGSSKKWRIVSFFSFLVIPKTSHSTTRILVMKFQRVFRTIFFLEKHHVYQISYCKCFMLLTLSQELVFPKSINGY